MSVLNWDHLVDTSGLELPEWQNIRQASAELIERVAPNAVVYPYFELEFDPGTLQRKVTPLLRGKNDDASIHHAWMVGLTSASILKNGDGQSEFVGAFAFTWVLNLEFEGFFDPSGNDPWATAENEVQAITVMFFRNQDMILEKCKFYEIEWSTIDLEAFADGNNLIVAQGQCRVDLQISIAV